MLVQTELLRINVPTKEISVGSIIKQKKVSSNRSKTSSYLICFNTCFFSTLITATALAQGNATQAKTPNGGTLSALAQLNAIQTKKPNEGPTVASKDNRSTDGKNQGKDPQSSSQGSSQNTNPNQFDIDIDADLATVLKEIGAKGRVLISADSTVMLNALVSLNLEKTNVEECLKQVVGNYNWKKRPNGTYIISDANPDAPYFLDFAKVTNYTPSNQTAESIFALIAPPIAKYVRIDKTSNMLVITAPEDRLSTILEMVKRIDLRARQFVVEALITELNSGKTGDYGFSWNWHNFGLDSGLNFNYAKATATDVATLKNLIGTQKATLRANPRILAFEGNESTLSVGTKSYLTIQTGYLTLQTAQIQIIETGVTLKVTGLIGEDGLITLIITSEVGDFTTPVNGYPTVTARKATTRVRVRSGETIVIGGLIQDTDTNITTKVPILGDLPLVGQIFRQRIKERKRNDIVMMLTPRITDDAGTVALTTNMPVDSNTNALPPIKPNANTQPAHHTVVKNVVPAEERPIQIHCSSLNYMSQVSGEWENDKYFNGGKLFSLGQGITSKIADKDLYSSFRSGEKRFSYNIPVPNGKYSVKLGFVEPTYTAPRQRMFDVICNGQVICSDLDIFEETGGNRRVLFKRTSVTISDGKLNLDLVGNIGEPVLSTIQITHER